MYVTFTRDNYVVRVAHYLTPRDPLLVADEDPYLDLSGAPGF
ncbi:hypothetical protein ABT009_37575 [Streptomyces sp. NPDC002896]